MRPLPVIPEIPLLAEGKATIGTREGLIVKVNCPVHFEFVAHAKCLGANVADVRFFTSVQVSVMRKLRPESVLGITARTRKGEMICVGFTVNVKRGALFEAFPALGTDIGALARVYSHVLRHILARGELDGADSARVVLDLLVGLTHVSPQPSRNAELLATQVAHARFLSRVDALVEDVRVRGVQLPQTHRAFVHFASVDYYFHLL